MTKILVIEDDKNIRDTLQDVLLLKSYKIITAEDGKAGVSKAIFEQPDLILCDIMMPEMDGYEVYKSLEQIPATRFIPFIFLTAKGQAVDFRTGLKLGADDYITKPFDVVDLLSSINKRLEKHQKLKDYNLNLFSSLVDSSLSGIFIYSEDKFILINKKFTDITKYTLKELNNTTLDNILLGNKQKLTNELCLCYKGLNKSIQLKFSVLNKEKKESFLELSGKHVKIDNKKSIIGNILNEAEFHNLQGNELISTDVELNEILNYLYKSDQNNIAEEITKIRNQMSIDKNIKLHKTIYKISLTKREKEILKLICMGLTNSKIGEKLFISKRTVDNHRTNILLKTEKKNTAELVAFAVSNKLISI